MNICYRDKPGRTHLLGDRFSRLDVMQSELILALTAVRAAFPVMGDYQKVRLHDTGLDLQNEAEDRGGTRGVLGDEGAERLDHPQANVIAEWHLPAGNCGEALGQVTKEGKVAISQVDPLSDAEQESDCLGAR